MTTLFTCVVSCSETQPHLGGALQILNPIFSCQTATFSVKMTDHFDTYLNTCSILWYDIQYLDVNDVRSLEPTGALCMLLILLDHRLDSLHHIVHQ